jgi:uncharacterized protein (DUF488 family)
VLAPQSEPPSIYSIGHSNHDLDLFISLLQRYQINILIDVRSQPYSRWVPDYNRESLQRALEENDLSYIHMGETLGGRPEDPSLYNSEISDSIPDYERVAESPSFQAGLQELLDRVQTDTVAMMCSEGDYRQCHRAQLITPHLLARGVKVIHIQPDGRAVEAQPEPKQLSLF